MTGSESYTLDIRAMTVVTLILNRDLMERDSELGMWKGVTDGLWCAVYKAAEAYYGTDIQRKGANKGTFLKINQPKQSHFNKVFQFSHCKVL